MLVALQIEDDFHNIRSYRSFCKFSDVLPLGARVGKKCVEQVMAYNIISKRYDFYKEKYKKESMVETEFHKVC